MLYTIWLHLKTYWTSLWDQRFTGCRFTFMLSYTLENKGHNFNCKTFLCIHFYLYFCCQKTAVHSLHVQEIVAGRTEDKIRHCALWSGSTPSSPSSILPSLHYPSYLLPLSWPPPCCVVFSQGRKQRGTVQVQVNTIKNIDSTPLIEKKS